METITLEDIKAPVGRPEGSTEARNDLTEYMLSAKFKRHVTKFFNYWDQVVKAKAKGKQLYISNMENFFGEILDKFEELPKESQLNSLKMQEPFRMLSESTNLKLPEVFPNKRDSRDFIEIFLQHNFCNK